MKTFSRTILIFVGSLIFACNIAESDIFLEDNCQKDEPTEFSIIVKKPFKIDVSYTSSLRVSRRGPYSTGLNCTVKIRCADPEYDVIVSIEEIDFKPGCRDYLKISDGSRKVGLCGSKYEHDSNMQFYGKEIYLHYVTESIPREVISGLIGFSLSFTSSKKYNPDCERLESFRCANQYCIHKRFTCDGVNNCGDFTDELSCSSLGTVIIIAMFLVSVMGVVGGFCISLCLTAIWSQTSECVSNTSLDILTVYSSVRRSDRTLLSCCSRESSES